MAPNRLSLRPRIPELSSVRNYDFPFSHVPPAFLSCRCSRAILGGSIEKFQPRPNGCRVNTRGRVACIICAACMYARNRRPENKQRK